MIIEVFSNGQKLNIGDVFKHDNRKWVITHFDLNRKDELKYIYALDEDLAEGGVFASFDDKVMEMTGENYGEIYKIKKALGGK